MTDNSDILLYVKRERFLYIIYGIKGKHSYITVQKPSSKRVVHLTLRGRTACMGLGKPIKISGFKKKEEALEFYLERVQIDDQLYMWERTAIAHPDRDKPIKLEEFVDHSED